MAIRHELYCDRGHTARQQCNHNLQAENQQLTESVEQSVELDSDAETTARAREWAAYIVAELQGGRSGLQVVEGLEAQGWDRRVAWEWVHTLSANVGQQDYESAPVKETRFDHLAVGVVAIGAGLAITGCTYATAGPGETYYIVWGPVVYGGYRLLLGLLSRR